MDLLKKKFEKKKKKGAAANALNKKPSKAKISARQKKNAAKKKKKKAKDKKKRKSSRNNTSSSSESSESDESDRRTRAVASVLAADAANIDKRYRMAGALVKKPENPTGFTRKILEAEWREMLMDPSVTMDQLKVLDDYLKNRAELKSTDHIVISEKVDEDDKKSTTHLKILTKYDEGRFAAIYMVTNESAVDNTVISVTNGRFMMKTALRQLSSHQITYRLHREISVLKLLWAKKDENQPRIPPILHEGRMLGVPFYVTTIYDANIEKVREEMGGGGFSIPSAFWIAQEVLVAMKFLHRRQIIHRDIKPANLVSSWQNRDHWFLIDFGEAISVGKTTALSPPDGYTLPFLSREAHDVLNTAMPSTLQQDLESWFYLLIDLIKPLPWRENTNIQEVANLKKEFFKTPRVPDFTPQITEIQKLLRTDTSPGYPLISKQMLAGFNEGREGLGGAKWVPEWHDRVATRKARQHPQRAGAKKMKANNTRSVEEEQPQQTSVNTSGEQTAPSTANDKRNSARGGAVKKNQSMYMSVMGTPGSTPPPTPPPANTQAVSPGGVPPKRLSKESGNAPASAPGSTPPPASTPTNRTSIMLDDMPPPTNAIATPVPSAPPARGADRSVYFNDFPPAQVADANNKKKMRYRPKK
uniref:Protein kinase domain-containing protein n=1 Tax=Caenorhabditis japonica TaxID=281687 RepID=A0A8R1I757_CAEJA